MELITGIWVGATNRSRKDSKRAVSPKFHISIGYSSQKLDNWSSLNDL